MKKKTLWLLPHKKDLKRLFWTFIYQEIDNIKETKILEAYNLLRLNHEEIKNLNRPITNKEIDSVIKKSQQRKTQDHMVSLKNAVKHLKN
jgi:hypothetical protein